MPYRIHVERNAEKDLDKLNRGTHRRVTQQIRNLAGNPRPPGCVRIVGAPDLWRVRVGDYRIIYSINDDQRVVRDRAAEHGVGEGPFEVGQADESRRAHDVVMGESDLDPDPCGPDEEHREER